MRQTLAGSILVGLGSALLWMFLVIYLKGKLYVWEPNEWILSAEIAMCVFIIGYGLIRAYNGIRKRG